MKVRWGYAWVVEATRYAVDSARSLSGGLYLPLQDFH